MSLKKFKYLFWSTLLVGGIASLFTGFYLLLTDAGLREIEGSNAVDLLVFLLFNTGIGLMYSVFAQMGFFAYLTLNYIAKSMIKRRLIWATTQWIIVAIVFFDVIYLRYTRPDIENHGLVAYSILPIILFVVALIVARWKSQLTNASAFTPTVFFIFAVTILEIVPALKANQVSTTVLAAIPVLSCNVWQIMKLHTILDSGENAETSQA